jgi:hypothetical protein
MVANKETTGERFTSMIVVALLITQLLAHALQHDATASLHGLFIDLWPLAKGSSALMSFVTGRCALKIGFALQVWYCHRAPVGWAKI